jgi:type II secretory pathway component GspD/PulD (secretin)
LTFGFAHGSIAGFIRAAEAITDVTVLARPKILAINKQLGQIFIGDKLGYEEGSIITDGGAEQTGAIKFLETGTKLSFRAFIGNDGYIRMDIHPKDSSGTVPGGIPQETSAELATNIMVKDGETIVIGGLFKDSITTTKTQIPILGDLPIIGAAFRGTADQTIRREVVVLLTPHIIEEPSQTGGFARAEDVARINDGTSQSLMWIGRSRLAEDNYAEAVKYYIAGDSSAALKKLDTALNLYPSHLDSLRLKDRIAEETDPEAFNNSRRIQLEAIDEQEAPNWRRR